MVRSRGASAQIRATCWLTDLSGLRGAVPAELTTITASDWESVHRIDLPRPSAQSRRATLELLIESEVGWSLTEDRGLRPVIGPTRPPEHVGRFVVVRTQGQLRRLEFPWATRLELARRGKDLVVQVELFDVEACGLARWGPDKLAVGVPRALDIFDAGLNDLDDCLWVEPYPRGAAAALCLTDHPDFDTVEKVQVLTDLFVRLGLRFTKGVFPVREPLGAKDEPGVDVPEYRRIVERLHETGNEIAFHGIGPRPRAPEAGEFRKRLEVLRPFSPSTWIDHGVGDYLFSRRGHLQGGEPLVEILTEAGVVNYWSYVDNWSNPFGDLRSGAVRSDGNAVGDFVRAVATLTGNAQGMKGFLYPASHLANNLLGEIGALAVRGRPLSASAWGAAMKSRRAHRSASERPMPLYGTDGMGFALTDSPHWVFDTVLLSHPAFELSPAAVDRLCQASGLSLVHCYLACTHSYIGGGCFDRGREAILHPAFVANLEYVAQRQKDGDLCVLPLRDLRVALSDFRRTRLERVKDGWRFGPNSSGADVTIGGLQSAIEGLRPEKGSRFRGARPRFSVKAEPGLVLGL
jgi:hypothetical protein